MSEPAEDLASDRPGARNCDAAARDFAGWLALAAAPTFALMALLTAGLGGGEIALICGSPPAPFSIGGMAPMYLLMSAFHAGPWLRRSARRKADAPS